MELTYTQAKEIINTIGRFKITGYDHYGLTVLSVGNREFAIGTEDEADYAWEKALGSYWDECVLPVLPEWINGYLDYDKWESDAKMDGRGHALSNYDGCETDVADLVMFRTN